MQYLTVQLFTNCEPLLIDSTELGLLNAMQANKSDNALVEHNETSPLKKHVVYGVFKAQFNKTPKVANVKAPKHDLVVVFDNELYRCQLHELVILNENVTYSFNNQSKELKTNDIGFAALISLPSHITIAAPHSCHRIPALSLYEHNSCLPLLESFKNRSGIYAIKSNCGKNKEHDEPELDNWKQFINRDLALTLISTTI